MASSSDLIKNRFKIINEADKDLLSNLSSIESKTLDKLLAFLSSQFDLSGGRFAGGNFNEINQIANEIRKELIKAGYQENVISYVTDFDNLRKNTEQLAAARKLGNTANIGLTGIQRGAQQLTINGLLGTGLDVNFIDPVKEIIFNSVQSNSTIAEAEISLRQYITGDAERLGHLERYATQISRDSISQFQGTMDARMFHEFDLDGYQYVGSLIQDSRPQCVRWVGLKDGIIKKEQLQDEINWALTNGSGMVQGTTPATFAIYRGGYNCRHDAIPIRL